MKFLDNKLLDIIKGAGLNFIFYAINLLLVYALAIVIGKYFGPEVYGRYAIIKSLLLILIIISTLGTNTLATKLAADESHFMKPYYYSDFVRKSYRLFLMSSFLISFVIFIFRKEISTIFFNDIKLENYLFIFPIFFIFITILNYNSNLLKGQKRVLAFSYLSSFLNNFIFFCALLAFVFFLNRSSETIIIYSFTSSIVIAAIFSLTKVFPLKYHITKKTLATRNILSKSFPMMISASMLYVVFSIDILFLGYFENSINVGIYRVVTQITSVNTTFLIIFSVILSPHVSSLHATHKVNELKNTVYKSIKLLFLSTTPLFLLILIFSKDILLFFGENYVTGYASLLVLCCCQFLYAISGFVELLLNMTGHHNEFGKITFFTAALNIGLNFILIPNFGILGAALATGSSIVLTNFIALIIVYRKLGIISIYIPCIKLVK